MLYLGIILCSENRCRYLVPSPMYYTTTLAYHLLDPLMGAVVSASYCWLARQSPTARQANVSIRPADKRATAATARSVGRGGALELLTGTRNFNIILIASLWRTGGIVPCQPSNMIVTDPRPFVRGCRSSLGLFLHRCTSGVCCSLSLTPRWLRRIGWKCLHLKSKESLSFSSENARAEFSRGRRAR